jgi:hypothetical protein
VTDYPIKSAEHAFTAGLVFGLMMKHGLDFVPVLADNGDYSAAFELDVPELPEGVRLTVVVPEPPETDDGRAQ